MAGGVILGVDFGTSNTVAVLGGPGRPTIRLLFDGSLRLPSGIYATDGNRLLTGRDAVQASHTHPERYVAHPKAKMADQYIALGPHEFTPIDLVVAVFERVLAEATRTAQNEVPPPEIVETVITYPEYWRAGRIQALKTAADRVGMPRPRLIKEPIAAANKLSMTQNMNLREDRAVVVYDLGAGTFDASVVRRATSGFEIVGEGTGLPGVAGLALDRAIAQHLSRQVARKDADAAERVEHPTNNQDRIEAQLFMDRVREARESLSVQSSVQIYFPHHEELTLTRDKFEELAEPILLQTVDRTKELVSDAGLAISDIDRIFLVGGASQAPVVAELLRREFKRPAVVMTDPEQVVAEGSIGADATVRGETTRYPSQPIQLPQRPPQAEPDPLTLPPPRSERKPAALRIIKIAAGVLIIATVASAATTAVIWRPWVRDDLGASTSAAAVPVLGDGVLRIAALMALTGNLSALDEGPYTGFDLAIQDINDAGGVLGKEVVALRTDSGDNAEVANKAVDTLLSRDADVVIGTTSSSLTLQVIDRITGSGMLQISPSNTALRLTDYEDHGLFFRTAPPDTFQGGVLADLVIRDGKRKLGMFVRRDAWAQGLGAIVQVAMEKAKVQVVRADYAEGDNDFSQEVATVKGAAPDAIMIMGYDETRLLINEMVKNGITTKNTSWYLTDGNINDYKGAFAPGTLEGTKATLPGSQVSAELQARLRTLKPDLKDYVYAPEGYDSTVLAALAAIEAKSDKGTEIAKHMISVSRDGRKCFAFRTCKDLIAAGVDIDYDGVSGKIEFDSAGDPGEAAIGVHQYGADNGFTDIRYITKVR